MRRLVWYAVLLVAAQSLRAATIESHAHEAVATLLAERRFACVEHRGTHITSTTVIGDDAFVEMLVDATGTLPITLTPREFPPRWRLQFHRADDDWCLVRVDSLDRELATALAFADPPEQERLLNAGPISSELVYQLVEMGLVLGSKGQFAREERVAHIAIMLAGELRDPLARARALWVLARARDMQNAHDEALGIYDEARVLAERHGDRETAGRALVGYGFTQVSRWDFGAAREPLQRGLAIALSGGDHMMADNAYLAMANMSLYSGDYIDALRSLDLAREHAEKAGDRVVVAAATANAGLVFHEMNNYSLAAERLRDAIVVYRELGNVRGEIRNLRNLADVEAGAKHDDAAAAYLDRVEAHLAKAPDDRLAAFTAATRATIALHRRDLATADRQATRALELAAKAGQGQAQLVAVLTSTLSGIRLDGGRYAEAAELAEKAVELSRNTPWFLPRAKLPAARAYRKLGRTQDAIAALQEAVDSIESQAANVPGTEEEQQSFYLDKTAPYYEMFDLLVEQNQRETALEWIERSRTRFLIEYLGRNRVSADRGILSAEERRDELAREQEIVTLNRNLRELYSQPARDSKAIARLEEEVRRKRFSLHEHKAKLYSRRPELALARGAIPRPSLAEIQKLIPADGAVLQYVVGADATWLIVIRNSGRPDIVRIDIDADDLQHRVTVLAKQIAERNLASHAGARAMYDLLLRPAERLVRSKKSLCIVPDDALWEVPFQALAGPDGRYLVEKHAIFYTPSLSLLAWHAAHPPALRAKAELLVVANPQLTERTIRMAKAIERDETLAPLPDAEEEARQIKALYGGDARVVTGMQATEAFLKSNAGRYRILHVASHAAFNNTMPLHSHLVLAAGSEATEDGLLEAREIMNLDVAADLVVLSSCETGRGQVRGGDGLTGTSWALLVAGCPTAVVSQWKVGSAATAKLMTEFHRRLARVPARDRRRAAARALHEAQLAVMRMPRYRHPYDWSAFVVVGNGW